MKKRATAIVLGLVGAAVLTGGAIAIAGGDSEGGAAGPQADRAVKAALQATGGGTANAVERDGEAGATWEVEVTKTNGQTVDVRLDENYKVVVIDTDEEISDTGDSSE
jgi:hypothetical protein